MTFPFSKNSTVWIVMFFGIVLFVALLPISSFLFYIKNDAFINYFPPKFFMSESLHAGYLPLWNPYINFGIPQYADMNAAYWSPLTWLIAGTVGYNAYSFTLETLFYILLSGLGMYVLSGCWIHTKNIRIIAGVAFMCCGYHIGHLQHFNWLAASAFLPWCLWSYIRFNEDPSPARILRAVLIFYLFVASAHPGQIIGAIYFFITIAFFIFFSKRDRTAKKNILRFSGIHLAFAGALLVLCVGIIAGYSDIIPYFIRGEKPAWEDTIRHSSTPASWISLVLPMSTVKNPTFFQTDISLRNSYFGLLLLLFLLYSLFLKKTGWQKLLLFTGTFFLLLSAGGIVKSFAYHYLPFIGYVRLGGEFRIFAVFCFIIVAGIQMEKYRQTGNAQEAGRIRWIALLPAGLLSGALLYSIYKIADTKDSLLYQRTPVAGSVAQAVKSAIDSMSFYDTIVLQGSFQLLLLILLLHCLRHKKLSLLKTLFVLDMIFASLLNVPFTGAGQTSVASVQKVLNNSPRGIPIPSLQPISSNDSLPGVDQTLVGHWSMYSKEPGTVYEMPYPIQLKNMRAYFDNVQKNAGYNYADKPFLYADSSSTMIRIKYFSPNEMMLQVAGGRDGNLVFLQNRYPYWQFKNSTGTFATGMEGLNFMRIPFTKETTEITLSFNPRFIRSAIFFTAAVFVLYLLIIILYKPKRSSLS